MTAVRRAAAEDVPTLTALWEAFEREEPAPTHRVGSEDDRAEIARYVADHLALLAEDDGRAVGFALAKLQPPRICFLSDLYVVPESRRRGIAKALIGEVSAWAAERGADTVTLVSSTSAGTLAVYDRLGFREESRNLFVPLEALAGRLAAPAIGASFGSIHVQTDDREAIARAVEIYVPRLPGASRGSVVTQPRNGWVAVYDELGDRDPEMLRRLALSISDRIASVLLLLGVEDEQVVRYILIERGRILDEYLSVPEYHGPLPPGDVIGLGANPTVAQRLTGADPVQVREVARVGRSPAELPPAREHVAALGSMFGVSGADLGWAEARQLEGALLLERG